MNIVSRVKQVTTIGLLALTPISVLSACSSNNGGNDDNKAASSNSFFHVVKKNKSNFNINGLNNTTFKVENNGAVQKIITKNGGSNTVNLHNISDLNGKGYLTNSDGYSLITIPVDESVKTATLTLKSGQKVPTTHGAISDNNKFYAIFVVKPIIQQINISTINWTDNKNTNHDVYTSK